MNYLRRLLLLMCILGVSGGGVVWNCLSLCVSCVVYVLFGGVIVCEVMIV